MERIGHRAAHDAAGRAVRVLTPRRALLFSAFALVLFVPALVGAAQQDLPTSLAARFNEGVAALAAGRLDPAEAAFRAVILAGGDRAFVRHNLGIVLQRRGKHAPALVEFRAASRLDPSFGASHLLAGASLLALGQARAAMAELDRASELMPRQPAVHLQRAVACERLNDVLCLTDEYRVLVDLAPANPEYSVPPGQGLPATVAMGAHADPVGRCERRPPQPGPRPRISGAGAAGSGRTRVSAGRRSQLRSRRGAPRARSDLSGRRAIGRGRRRDRPRPGARSRQQGRAELARCAGRGSRPTVASRARAERDEPTLHRAADLAAGAVPDLRSVSGIDSRSTVADDLGVGAGDQRESAARSHGVPLVRAAAGTGIEELRTRRTAAGRRHRATTGLATAPHPRSPASS